MVQCISTFMDLCYIFRRNAITSTALASAETLLKRFHELRCVFITEGVRESISLPRQHALVHYLTSIPLFGSPNGLCSSITESKHIKAVKEPWRRSSRFKALIQMLRTIIRLDKLAALRRRFLREGLLVGSTSGYLVSGREEARVLEDERSETGRDDEDMMEVDGLSDLEDVEERVSNAEELGERVGDVEPDNGPQSLSSIVLAAVPGTDYSLDSPFSKILDTDYLFQRDGIPETSTGWLSTSMSPNSPPHSRHSFFRHAIPIACYRRILKPMSISAAKSLCIILLSVAFTLRAISVVLLECTASGSGAIHHGMVIPGVTLCLSFKMTTSLVWPEC